MTCERGPLDWSHKILKIKTSEPNLCVHNIWAALHSKVGYDNGSVFVGRSQMLIFYYCRTRGSHLIWCFTFRKERYMLAFDHICQVPRWENWKVLALFMNSLVHSKCLPSISVSPNLKIKGTLVSTESSYFYYSFHRKLFLFCQLIWTIIPRS